MTKEIHLSNFKLGNNHPLFLIAGPCVIESERLCIDIAKELQKITRRLNMGYVFKASYDKANRTSIHSFRGIGIDKGIKVLQKIKEELNIPILSDVHCATQIKKVKDVLDIIQIPAFLSRQTDLILAAAKTQKIINIKRGQFLAPGDIINAIEKVTSVGNDKVLITERGVSFGYNNLVVDMTSFPIMRKFGYPVIFDATHSVQKPGGAKTSSSGASEFVPYLIAGAVGVGIDGLFLETHPEPEKALSDGPNMVRLDKIEEMLVVALKIDKIIKSCKRKN